MISVTDAPKPLPLTLLISQIRDMVQVENRAWLEIRLTAGLNIFPSMLLENVDQKEEFGQL